MTLPLDPQNPEFPYNLLAQQVQSLGEMALQLAVMNEKLSPVVAQLKDHESRIRVVEAEVPKVRSEHISKKAAYAAAALLVSLAALASNLLGKVIGT